MRHRETTVFSCGPQTGKGFILEITLRIAEELCKIKGNFLLIHSEGIIIYSLHTDLTDVSLSHSEKQCRVSGKRLQC